MSAGRRGRGLREDEQSLWTGVTKSIIPLRKARRAADRESAPESVPPKAVRPRVAANPVKIAPAPAFVPPPMNLDRQSRQKIAKGRIEIEGRIDLHGMTQADAHAALTRFLRLSQSKGRRTVLVITGKGTFGRDGERGVLKRQVPHWLALPELRAVVQGFEHAAVTHGGEGALYVRLRKARM
jgi:DNA-nicking Smr family endonuclease